MCFFSPWTEPGQLPPPTSSLYAKLSQANHIHDSSSVLNTTFLSYYTHTDVMDGRDDNMLTSSDNSRRLYGNLNPLNVFFLNSIKTTNCGWCVHVKCPVVITFFTGHKLVITIIPTCHERSIKGFCLFVMFIFSVFGILFCPLFFLCPFVKYCWLWLR